MSYSDLLPSSATQVKRRIRKMSYRFVIEGSDLFYLEKDKLSDNMVKRLVITKDKLSTVFKSIPIFPQTVWPMETEFNSGTAVFTFLFCL
jgi:hypothetical protein